MRSALAICRVTTFLEELSRLPVHPGHGDWCVHKPDNLLVPGVGIEPTRPCGHGIFRRRKRGLDVAARALRAHSRRNPRDRAANRWKADHRVCVVSSSTGSRALSTKLRRIGWQYDHVLALGHAASSRALNARQLHPFPGPRPHPQVWLRHTSRRGMHVAGGRYRQCVPART